MSERLPLGRRKVTKAGAALGHCPALRSMDDNIKRKAERRDENHN
jgi:hypothetical protein